MVANIIQSPRSHTAACDQIQSFTLSTGRERAVEYIVT